jgi:hypothetical protein
MPPKRLVLEDARIITARDAYDAVEGLHCDDVLTRAQAHKLITLALAHAPCAMTLEMRTHKGAIYISLGERRFILTSECKLRAA